MTAGFQAPTGLTERGHAGELPGEWATLAELYGYLAGRSPREGDRERRPFGFSMSS